MSYAYGFCCVCCKRVRINIHGTATQHFSPEENAICAGGELGADVTIAARDSRIVGEALARAAEQNKETREMSEKELMDDAWDEWSHLYWSDDADMDYVQDAFQAGYDAALRSARWVQA